MKKIAFLLMISLLAVSCNKDDDSSNENKLTKPTLLTPSNNTTVDVGSGGWYEFVWSKVENADQYLIQLSSTSNFSNIIDDDTVVVDEDDYYNTRVSFYLRGLENGGTYYWRVRAFGAGYEASDYSSSFSFKVNLL